MKDEILKTILKCTEVAQSKTPSMCIAHYINKNFLKIYSLYKTIDSYDFFDEKERKNLDGYLKGLNADWVD